MSNVTAILMRVLPPRVVPGGGTVGDQIINVLRQAALEVQQVATAMQARSSGESIDSAVTGARFELPSHIPTQRLLSHLRALNDQFPLVLRAGIVVDVLAECMWTILGHLVALAIAATMANVSSSAPPQQQQQNSSFTSAATTTNPAAMLVAQLSPEERARNLETARRLFIEQAPLMPPAASLTIKLFRNFPRVVSPTLHGPDTIAWCERLTPEVVVQQQSNSNNSNNNNNSKSEANIVQPLVLHSLHADFVIQLWSILVLGVGTSLDQKVEQRGAGNAALLSQCADFFGSAASYFLGAAARVFARSDDSAAVAWCEHVVAFLPVVADHFTNSDELQRQVLFDHVSEVMSRFVPEQISVLTALLFARFFSVATPRIASSVAQNRLLIENAMRVLADQHEQQQQPPNRKEKEDFASSSSSSSCTFSSHPVKCVVACLVAVATSSPDVSSATEVAYLDSTPLLSLAVNRCMTDAGAKLTASAASATTTTTPSQGLAQITLLCMLRKLDTRRQQAAATKALAPWMYRFQVSLTPVAPSIARVATNATSFSSSSAQTAVAVPEGNEHGELNSVMTSIVQWSSRALLEYPPPPFYQLPTRLAGEQQQKNDLRALLVAPFIDGLDLVAAQHPRGADLVATALLNALMKGLHIGNSESQSSASSFPNAAAATASLTSIVAPVAGAAGLLTITTRTTALTTALVNGINVAVSSQLNKKNNNNSNNGSALDVGGGPRRFLSVRANTIITIVEKLRRSLFSAVDAAAPWGKLVPRRLYSETALALYDVISLAFSSFAADALAIKDNNQFIQSMLQVTRRLIPLAQPFCLAAVESPTTVNQLIDRFERSIKDVELGARAQQQQQQQMNNTAAGAAASPHNQDPNRATLTYKYLVASFTLSAMTDQQGIRVMPNEVFSNRWVPLLARTCAAIDADSVTRGLLQVHCRNCCSALLRSRRTVCPPQILTMKEPSVGTTSLYSSATTTEEFIKHVATFLAWVIKPVVEPARSAVTRRLAANTFSATFSAVLSSVERLENEACVVVGSGIAVNAVNQVGMALRTQIRFTAPQIQDKAERSVHLDGSTKFAEGLASCVACLDDKVREAVHNQCDAVMLSPLAVLPMSSKKKILETMVRAVGLSKFLRGERRDSVTMWIAVNEEKWMKEDERVAAARRPVLQYDFTRSKL